MSSKNAVAKTKEQEHSLVVVQDQVPDYIKQEGNRGSENVTMEDMVIPRLEIVQGLSPAVKRGDPGYIDGAKLGDLNNSVTRKLYGDEIFLVPVHFSVQYLVWQQRRYIDPATNKEVSTDGGFFGAYPTQHEAQARADQEGGLAKGIEVLDTPQHLCLSVDRETGDVEEIMVSMPRTKAKISRQWNSLIKLAGGDRFSRVYRLGTELQKNTQGDFYNFSVKQAGFPSKNLYERAEALYEVVSKGERRVVMDVTGLSEAESTQESGEF